MRVLLLHPARNLAEPVVVVLAGINEHAPERAEDGDGRPELLVGDEKGRIHAFKRTGRELSGWPASASGCVVTSTVSASAFAGGRSVAVGCEDGKVHVLDGEGRAIAVQAGAPIAVHDTLVAAARPVYEVPIEQEYDIPPGSDAVKEVTKCLAYCRQALA